MWSDPGRATHGYMDTLGYFQMCSIADTGYLGYLCIADTQYCTYLHRSSIADTGYCIADTGYTHTLKHTRRARRLGRNSQNVTEIKYGRSAGH